MYLQMESNCINRCAVCNFAFQNELNDCEHLKATSIIYVTVILNLAIL